MLNRFSKFSVAMILLIATSLALHASDVSAYYDAPYHSAKSVKSKLSHKGFKVLTSYSPAGNSNLTVMVFTNKSLTAMASKTHRGFAAVQRVLVDSTAKRVRVTNPSYWLEAFMQKEYKAGSGKAVASKLQQALGKLTPTKEVLSQSELSGYHFMMAMPYYEDMIELKSATGVKANKKLFELKLSNGSKLIGVKMSKGSENFIDKIGTQNALLLPYTILIENGKAYALHPKYYLAISYPLLSMGQFMKISSIPDTIERSLKKSLK